MVLRTTPIDAAFVSILLMADVRRETSAAQHRTASEPRAEPGARAAWLLRPSKSGKGRKASWEGVPRVQAEAEGPPAGVSGRAGRGGRGRGTSRSRARLDEALEVEKEAPACKLWS